jgi:urocanate hydratase
MCFDYGFGPLDGWVCTSGKPEDLQTDDIACAVLDKWQKLPQ